jgi:hypothetical protein
MTSYVLLLVKAKIHNSHLLFKLSHQYPVSRSRYYDWIDFSEAGCSAQGQLKWPWLSYVVYQISTNSLDILCSLWSSTIFRIVPEARGNSFLLSMIFLLSLIPSVLSQDPEASFTHFNPSLLSLSHVKLHPYLRID